MLNNSFLLPERALPATARNFFVASCRINLELVTTVLRCQIELLNFFKHRHELYQSFLDDLAESVELNDTFEVVADFTHNALIEGSRETARLAGISSEVAPASAKLVRELAEGAVNDMAAQTCA
ncbi:hypothetical protein [Rhizobium bangladeshense]|uniref:hypothetical protein n=1 Tax=Rhizobium bangladeshense TaxID=1138189 RepID=UPI0007E5B987|nr:hypothetical protein [Rhizobium bangladeshense]MBX4892868.1 hypothetical protein [Rhizobium bangladeshense]MBX4918277.1 hypothetical protein [Rhizobium bangladeshense]